jgi:hypothetical protein
MQEDTDTKSGCKSGNAPRHGWYTRAVDVGRKYKNIATWNSAIAPSQGDDDVDASFRQVSELFDKTDSQRQQMFTIMGDTVELCRGRSRCAPAACILPLGMRANTINPCT